MKIFVVLAVLVAVASAQYEYTPPQRGFNAGGDKDKPTYGPPNHQPGEPEGPAPQAPVTASAPVFAQAPVTASAPVFAQRPVLAQAPAAPAFPQQQYQQNQGGYQQQEHQAEAYTPQVFRHVYVHTAPDEPEEVQSRTIRIPGGDKHVNIIFVKTPSQSSSSQTEVILPQQDEHKNLVYVLLKKAENSADVKIRRPAPAPQRKPEVYFIRYGAQQQQQQNQGGYQQQHQQQNGGYQQHQQHQGGYQQQQPAPVQQQVSQGPSENGGYQQAPSAIRVPAPIRSPADIPSSGYGLPL